MREPPPQLSPPWRGASNAQPYVETPGDSNPLEAMRNVRPKRTTTGRKQIAGRPGLLDTFGRVFGTIQAMVNVPRSSGISGYQTGARRVVRAGTSVPSDKMRGQFLILDPDWSVRAILNDTRGTTIYSPPAGAGGYGGFGVCFHPTDPAIGYVLTIAQDTTASNQAVVIPGISRVSLTTNAFTHQTYALDTDAPYNAGSYPSMPATGQGDLFPNKIAANGGYLFVAVRNYVYCFRGDTLAFVKRHLIADAQGRVCEEVQSIACATIGGIDYLFVLCEGSNAITAPVVADPGPSRTTYFGWFFRGYVGAYTVQYTDAAAKTPVAGGSAALAFKRLPQGTQNGDPAYEDHGTFRISEWSLQRPRGPLLWDLDIGQDDSGGVYAYVARTNQGFGYDGSATQRPDGTVAYVSACRAVLTRGFEPDAPTYISPTSPVRYGFNVDQGGWETDTTSLRKAFSWHGSTISNDIPNAIGDLQKHDPHYPNEAPSLFAVAVDEARDRVYFAGRRPSPSQPLPNVYCLRASDGARLWTFDAVGQVQQNGITVDPTSGNVVVGGNRNTTWAGSGGNPAEAWELDAGNGSVARTLDLTDAVTKNTFIGPNNEIQRVSITGSPTGGTFTLTFDGQTTAGIAYNANAAAVQAALEALSNIGVGDVACTGGALPGTPVDVEFTGALGMTNLPNMTANSSGLSGGSTPTAAVNEIQIGGIIPGVYDVAINTQGRALVALNPYRYDQ